VGWIVAVPVGWATEHRVLGYIFFGRLQHTNTKRTQPNGFSPDLPALNTCRHRRRSQRAHSSTRLQRLKLTQHFPQTEGTPCWEMYHGAPGFVSNWVEELCESKSERVPRSQDRHPQQRSLGGGWWVCLGGCVGWSVSVCGLLRRLLGDCPGLIGWWWG